MGRKATTTAAGRRRVTQPGGDAGPGVPEALPRTLEVAGSRLGTGAIDCLWVFPPLVQGRKEWGLVATSCYDQGRKRRLITVRYTAARTGKGLFLETRFADQGASPPERLPGVMAGVVKRGPALGPPNLVEIGGDEKAFEALMAKFPARLFEEPVIGRQK